MKQRHGKVVERTWEGQRVSAFDQGKRSAGHRFLVVPDDRAAGGSHGIRGDPTARQREPDPPSDTARATMKEGESVIR
jgi:hypothetical protein